MTISNCRLFITPWVEGLEQAKPSQNDVTHISRHHHRALLVAGAQLRHHHHHHHEHNVLLSTKSLLAYFVDIIFASVIAPHLNFKFKNLAILIKKVADGKNKDVYHEIVRDNNITSGLRQDTCQHQQNPPLL